jgi:hypothetical protein
MSTDPSWYQRIIPIFSPQSTLGRAQFVSATSDIFTKFFKKLAHAAALSKMKFTAVSCIHIGWQIEARIYTIILSKKIITTQRSFITQILKLLVSLLV